MKSRYDAAEQDLAQLASEAHGGLKRWQRFSSRFLTMKWSNRIAQGFSPGWTSRKTALKVATE
jgi:hypothetical protein